MCGHPCACELRLRRLDASRSDAASSRELSPTTCIPHPRGFAAMARAGRILLVAGLLAVCGAQGPVAQPAPSDTQAAAETSRHINESTSKQQENKASAKCRHHVFTLNMAHAREGTLGNTYMCLHACV